jgi:hypothetical protein
LLVIVRLGNGCIRFVASGRANAFVFVVNLGRGIEGFLQSACAIKRCRSPLTVDGLNLVRNLNPTFLADFLFNQAHGKEGSQVIGSDRLPSAGMENGG